MYIYVVYICLVYIYGIYGLQCQHFLKKNALTVCTQPQCCVLVLSIWTGLRREIWHMWSKHLFHWIQQLSESCCWWGKRCTWVAIAHVRPLHAPCLYSLFLTCSLTWVRVIQAQASPGWPWHVIGCMWGRGYWNMVDRWPMFLIVQVQQKLKQCRCAGSDVQDVLHEVPKSLKVLTSLNFEPTKQPFDQPNQLGK